MAPAASHPTESLKHLPADISIYLLALLPPIAVVDSEQNLDNPAVQLQGPFLQDRVNPPPARRNVVMIAAGTGINPSEKRTAPRCDGSI